MPDKRGPGRPVTTGTTPVRSARIGDVWGQAEAKWRTERGDNATITDLLKRLLAGYADGTITLP